MNTVPGSSEDSEYCEKARNGMQLRGLNQRLEKRKEETHVHELNLSPKSLKTIEIVETITTVRAKKENLWW